MHCAGKFPLMSMGGPSGGSRVCRPGSEDQHQPEPKFPFFFSEMNHLVVLILLACTSVASGMFFRQIKNNVQPKMLPNLQSAEDQEGSM